MFSVCIYLYIMQLSVGSIGHLFFDIFYFNLTYLPAVHQFYQTALSHHMAATYWVSYRAVWYTQREILSSIFHIQELTHPMRESQYAPHTMEVWPVLLPFISWFIFPGISVICPRHIYSDLEQKDSICFNIWIVLQIPVSFYSAGKSAISYYTEVCFSTLQDIIKLTVSLKFNEIHLKLLFSFCLQPFNFFFILFKIFHLFHLHV